MLRTASRDLHRRRGAVAAMVLVMLTVIIGFAALTVDVGTAYNVKADLQHAADASAIAGATALTSDAMMLARSGDDTAFEHGNHSTRASNLDAERRVGCSEPGHEPGGHFNRLDRSEFRHVTCHHRGGDLDIQRNPGLRPMRRGISQWGGTVYLRPHLRLEPDEPRRDGDRRVR